MRVIAVCAFALALNSLARAADVDWKMYGADSFYGDVVCFYDANGIIHTPAGHVRVRTKCLLQSVLDGIDKKSEIGRRIVKNTARKAVDNYVPPIAAIDNLDFEETISVIQYEETADIGSIEPHARFFYEINCSEHTMRKLSADIRINGKDDFGNEPSVWEAPQGGSGTALLKILCSP